MTETVSCGSCGAACAPEATFCWQCFTKKSPTAASNAPQGTPVDWSGQPSPAAAAPAAGGVAVAAPPAPPAPPVPAPQPTMTDVNMGRAPLISVSRKDNEPARRGFLHIKYHGILKPTLIGLFLLAVIGGIGWTFLEQKITLPDQIAGMPRVTEADAEAAELADQIEAELGRPADAAVYATPRVAAMTVVSMAGSPPGGARQMLLDIAEAEGADVAVRANLIRVYQSDGAHFACAPVVGAALPTACVWDDSSISGLVVTTHQRVPRARSLAVQAYLALGG